MVEWARRTDRLLAGLESVLVVLALLLLIVLSTYQVVIRNMGHTVPEWMNPLLHHMVLWVGTIGASLAVRSRVHIRLDVFNHWIKAPWDRRVQFLVSVLSAVICLLLARAGFAFVLSERELSVSDIAGVPSWYFSTIVPIAFALMSAHFLLSPWQKVIPRLGEDSEGPH